MLETQGISKGAKISIRIKSAHARGVKISLERKTNSFKYASIG